MRLSIISTVSFDLFRIDRKLKNCFVGLGLKDRNVSWKSELRTAEHCFYFVRWQHRTQLSSALTCPVAGSVAVIRPGKNSYIETSFVRSKSFIYFVLIHTATKPSREC